MRVPFFLPAVLALLLSCDPAAPKPVLPIARMPVPMAALVSQRDPVTGAAEPELPCAAEPATFVGTWKATLTSARMEGTGMPLSVPLPSDESFSLTIVQRDGHLSVDGPSPLALTVDGQAMVGRSDIVETRLALSGRTLCGEWIRSGSDGSILVVEFTAVQ
jgi:hypothetical protein